MRRFSCILIFGVMAVAASLDAQQPQSSLPYKNYSVVTAPKIYLWPKGAPMATGDAESDKPRLLVFLPKQQRSKTGVVVCPGGGYRGLSEPGEGAEIAAWLNGLGIAAFVLEYRVWPYHHPVELQDAARAMRWVRAHAEQYKIAPDQIGIFGASAGGHLAATLSTHFDDGDPKAADPLDRIGDRPDFTVLLYPVIAPVGPASEGSFKNLIGDKMDPALVESLSADKQVTAKTPPAFLALADNDSSVWPESSIRYYRALHEAGVSAELHIYQRGSHAFGIGWVDPVSGQWRESLMIWMQYRGLLN
jgi:acetyl esterase/lipase